MHVFALAFTSDSVCHIGFLYHRGLRAQDHVQLICWLLTRDSDDNEDNALFGTNVQGSW